MIRRHPILDMADILWSPTGTLRNGWWVLVFYLMLAALVVPVTLLTSRLGSSPGMALQAALVVVATLACLAFRREHPRTVFGTVARWRTGVPVGLAWGCVIWAVVALVLWLCGSVEWHWSGQGAAALPQGLIDCLAVACAEELLFRGFPFQRLIDGIGKWPAQGVMACYFVLVHSTGLAGAGELAALAIANIFGASLLFGAAYLRTRSLAVPIALHFALNFTQGPILGFGVSGNTSTGVWVPTTASAPIWWTGGSFGLEASLPGTIAVMVALAVVLFWPSTGVKA